MKKFTKLMLTLAFVVLGVGGASAEKLNADLSKLTTPGGTNASWDGESNTITWVGQSNNMVSNFNFPTGDYRSWEKVVVKIASLNNAIGVRIQIRANGQEKTKAYNGTGTLSVDLADFGFTADDLKTVEWVRMLGSGWYDGENHTISSETPGSAVIEEVYFERPDIVYIEASEVFQAPEGTKDLKTLSGTYEGNGWTSTVVYPKEFAVQGQAFGNGDGSNESFHVDVTEYDWLCFNVTSASANSAGLRVWIWNGSSVVTLYAKPIADYATANWAEASKITGVGTYVVKITDYQHLKGVKAANDYGSPSSVISMAWVSKGDAPVAYKPTGKYTLVGESLGAGSLTDALADASATVYDCTGVTGSGVELTPANPNALFVANEGVLTNTKNVIVGNTCANLVLTDQKPFKAPAAFTAANATFTKTMTDAEYATMMIPFTAAVPEGLVARNIKGNDDDVLITELVNGNVTNDKPVLLKGAAGDYVFTATDAEVAVADGIQDNGLLYGTYDATYNVPENSYVLQKQGDEVKFFKAVDGTTVKAFRAYLDLGHSEGSLFARNFTFDFENETTGLQQAAFAPQRQAVIYNLQGQRIAQPAQGLYIKGGKKVIIK